MLTRVDLPAFWAEPVCLGAGPFFAAGCFAKPCCALPSHEDDNSPLVSWLGIPLIGHSGDLLRQKRLPLSGKPSLHGCRPVFVSSSMRGRLRGLGGQRGLAGSFFK